MESVIPEDVLAALPPDAAEELEALASTLEEDSLFATLVPSPPDEPGNINADSDEKRAGASTTSQVEVLVRAMVPVSMPPGGSLDLQCAWLGDDTALEAHAEFCGSVSFLPDLELAVKYAPGSGWTALSVASHFLTPEQCRELRDITAEQCRSCVGEDHHDGGGGIDVVSYVVQLQNDFWEALNLDSVLQVESRRAAFQLLQNDRRKKEFQYRMSPHECPICCATQPGSAFLKLRPRTCGHAFCRDCLVNLVRVNVQETGALDQIRCMFCPKDEASMYDPTEIREILGLYGEQEDREDASSSGVAGGHSRGLGAGVSSTIICPTAAPAPTAARRAATSEHDKRELEKRRELFAKWEQMTLSRGLDSMEDIAYCPRCSANTPPVTVPVVVEGGDYCCCPSCQLQFCAKCLDVYHPERDDCEWAPSRSAIKQMKKQQIDESKSLAFISRTTKKCPHCRFGIQKSAGCNKMRCENCYTKFCWQCLEIIEDYDHFRNNPKCVLFDEQAIREWEREVENAGGIHRRDWAGAPPLGHPGFADAVERVRCASCRASVDRWTAGGEMRNNHLRCPFCQQHTCLACRSVIVSGPGQPVLAHFRPRGACPQFQRA